MIVFITVFINVFCACIGNSPVIENNDPGIINITVLNNGTPIIADPVLLDRADPDMSGITIILENSWLYDEGSIIWWISGTSIRENRAEFFIDAYDPAFKNLGFYYINVEAQIDGAPFKGTFTLNIFNSNEENDEQ